MPGAGDVRGKRYQARAGHKSRTLRPNTSTDAPQPQNARDGQPAGWLTTCAEA